MKDTTGHTHMGDPNIHGVSGVREGTAKGGRETAQMLGHINHTAHAQGVSLSLSPTLSVYVIPLPAIF
jgi:hypothetical protein